MSNDLRTALERLLRSGTHSNSALNVILADYRAYHVALVVGSGLVVLLLILLSVLSWRRFMRAPRSQSGKATLERKVWRFLALGSTALVLPFLVVCVANVTTAMDPRHGFSLLVDSMVTPRAGTGSSNVYRAADAWLQSSTPRIPPTIQHRIDDRLAWQRPKAIVCGILFVIVTALSGQTWRRVIKHSRAVAAVSNLRTRLHIATGVATAVVAVALVVMTIANAQASIAPVTISIFGASG